MTLEQVRAQLFPPADARAAPAFAVLDAARHEDIDRLTLAFSLRFLYLIDGVDDPALTRTAPRVIELGRTPTPGIDRLLTQGHGHSWGYYLRSRAPLLDVRDHLASLLIAELPDGSVVRFRLFDPRILRVYLPTCTPEELERAFGPVESFWLEDPTGGPLVCFARDAEGELSAAPPAPDDDPEAGAPRIPTLTREPLQIREAQLDALAARSRGDFVTRALAHLRRFFPAQCDALGEAKTRELLALGVARATRHGFVTEVEVCKYLNLMFSFGRDFDTQQIWARTLLRASRPGEDARMERLYGLAQVNEARALGRV